MKIFITGGAGFIGSHIVRVLLNQGHKVLVFDNLFCGHKDLVDLRADFIKGDTCDEEALLKVLAGQDAVIHLAALIQVPESVEKPLEYLKNNVIGTAVLLEAMRKTGVKKIIFSSSACVYGDPDKVPLTEDDPIKTPANPYGATKLMMEEYIGMCNKLWECNATILRYFNPYGPNELHQPETHAIPNFIKATLARNPIPLYWKGQQTRDFIYVEDLAQAHVAALNLEGLNIINLGTEVGTKVKDLIEIIFEVAGHKVPIKDLGERPGDAQKLVASYKKAEKLLGWQPKTSLSEGLKKTIEYFAKFDKVK